jgi:hypothetical protein
LGAKGLGVESSGEQALAICSPASTGIAAGAWCAFGAGGLPPDQRPDDARSLCFDSAPLGERVEILGAPAVELVFASDRPAAQVAVRLCDVAPDGSSTRVSYGLANLAHTSDHARVEPLVAGERRRARIALNDTAWSFAPGHRLRIAVSTAYWPLAWPAPEPATLTLFTDVSALVLPVRPPRPQDDALRDFGRPEGAARPEVVELGPGSVERQVTRDPASGEVVRRVRMDMDEAGDLALSRVEPIDLEVGYGIEEELRIRDGDPRSAHASFRQVSLARRGSWCVRVETRTRVSNEPGALRIEVALRASEDGREVFARDWDERIPRTGY